MAMDMDKDQVISIINDLIEKCKDTENSFYAGADSVKDSNLKKLFNTYAQEYMQFAAELQREIHRLDGKPERSGSVVGVISSGWMKIRSAVAGGNEGVVLAECESSMDEAVKKYKETLKVGLPQDEQAIVQRQYMQVKEGRDHISMLKKSFYS
jgi:uncharacterized protein (TIGR02284 family)